MDEIKAFIVEHVTKDLIWIQQSPLPPIALTALFTLLLKDAYDSYLSIDTDLISHFKSKIFRIVKMIPQVRKKIDDELSRTQVSLVEDINKSNKGIEYVRELPYEGLKQEEVLGKIEQYMSMNDGKWREGSCSGCVYDADTQISELATEIYRKYNQSNAMHADVFPDVRKMEAEVVRMICDMFNGDEDTCGTMTSGGTESLMLACKAYRDIAYKRGIKHPEMIVPETAHAAFNKAGQYFNIRVKKVPVDAHTKRASADLMRKYINSNTCLLVGSVSAYPYGSVDPIEDIAKLGVKYNIPVHVDACYGGFLVAFMRDAGYEFKAYDFSVPGVTSISCDTHKYGYTPKGSSVITYRNRYYREHQFYSITDWVGGLYASPTFAGSRPGHSIATTWATMMYVGRKGYVEATRQIIETTRFILKEAKQIKELQIMGECDLSVVAFTSKEFNVYHLLDELGHSWHLNALQNPSGIQIAVTKLHTQGDVAQRFVHDLKEAVARIMKKDDRKLGKVAQIYCSSQSVPDKSLISSVTFLYLDAIYNTKN